tara:strand:+ start:541 stop:1380 length:840 start_codon:yes stop_codon:yes gene_type:complete
MLHLIFLIVLAGIWLVFAAIYDLKKRMVPNWLSFSLIIFALGFRLFYSLFNENFLFFYQGLIGLGIFFIIGNALYYGRMFAGGDAKLMMALGPILGFSESFLENIEIFSLFIILFLFVGGFYGLIWSIFLSANNFKIFKKEFSRQFNNGKKIVYFVMAFALFFMVLGFFENLLFYLGILIFIMPYFYLYAKAVDNSCLIKDTSVLKLEEGDWLYRDLKIGNKILKSTWGGLTKNQIKEIKKRHKKIKIRQGIPFVPTFLISFLVLIYIYFQNVNLLGFF